MQLACVIDAKSVDMAGSGEWGDFAADRTFWTPTNKYSRLGIALGEWMMEPLLRGIGFC
jgi:hypothetical protein